MNLVNITINGKAYAVPEGSNVLEAALENGVYIPHLCHHKDLNPLGSCRMCIVEVDGEKGVTPSCTLKAYEGLSVRTDSDEIKRLRMLALELLLTGHPEDCSTCPKYGSCELQTLIQYIGPKTGRMKMRQKGFKPIENPLIVHDMNRCVLCGRCVRACNELRGVKVLQYQKKELETYVGTIEQKVLKDADCRFCGACAEVCPTGSIRDLWMKGQENLKKEDKVVPCRYACPMHTDVPRYIRYVREGRFDAAAAVVRERSPFPHTLGLVCNRRCEFACKRNALNQPMSIRDIKRYAAEHDGGKYWIGKGKQLPATGKKVCVIGAGPAGLEAAYYLRKQGHDVTVKEANPTPGGMLCYGIPAYRLPREAVAEEIAVIKDAGVKIECNCKVETPPAELLKDYDAVLVAVGNAEGTVLNLPGNDLPGVITNLKFLSDVSLGKDVKVGKSVIVVGAGNVALDCARTAKRLGAGEVHIVFRKPMSGMKANQDEIDQALEEGVILHPSMSFERINGDTHVTGMDFMTILSTTRDSAGREVVNKKEGSQQTIAADTVIFAVGTKTALPLECGLNRGKANSIAVKDLVKDKTTSEPGVFAAGDCIYGTKSVVEALQSGREAASQIDIYLGGDGDISEVLAPVEKGNPNIGHKEGFAALKRIEPVVDSPERRINFNLLDHGISDEEIGCETGRCMQCDLRLDISAPRLWADFSD